LTKRLVLSQYEWSRYDFGETITGKIYEEDGVTPYNATGLNGVVKSFKRHGDRAFFFRDVARALTVQGTLAQMISDVAITWTNQAQGEFSFAWTSSLRPSIPGFLWIEVEMTDSPTNPTKKLSTELVRTFVTGSEGA
jgi:hypothetical protein